MTQKEIWKVAALAAASAYTKTSERYGKRLLELDYAGSKSLTERASSIWERYLTPGQGVDTVHHNVWAQINKGLREFIEQEDV